MRSEQQAMENQRVLIRQVTQHACQVEEVTLAPCGGGLADLEQKLGDQSEGCSRSPQSHGGHRHPSRSFQYYVVGEREAGVAGEQKPPGNTEEVFFCFCFCFSLSSSLSGGQGDR